MTPDPRIDPADWQTVQTICAQWGVDPYLILAIGAHETGMGTLGDGRMPPLGSGHILGVGSYDSGSTAQWAGWGPQTSVGCATLVHLGIRTIADVKAGKAHVSPSGQIRWASADVAPDYPWTAGVVAAYNQLHPVPATSWPWKTRIVQIIGKAPQYGSREIHGHVQCAVQIPNQTCLAIERGNLARKGLPSGTTHILPTPNNFAQIQALVAANEGRPWS